MTAAGSARLEAAPEDWETPDADFEAHVGEVVRVRLGRHLLAPPGPACITPPDAHALYAKVTGEILGKERQVRACSASMNKSTAGAWRQALAALVCRGCSTAQEARILAVLLMPPVKL